MHKTDPTLDPFFKASRPFLFKTKKALFAFVLVLSAAPFSFAEFRREPSRKLEHLYAEAVLSYETGDYKSALEKVDSLLAQGRDQKTLELKALILKTQEKYTEARNVHQQILSELKAAKSPDKDLAPSTFELALLDYRDGKYPAALKEFKFCIENEYNIGAVNFFLGLIDLQQNAPENPPAAPQAEKPEETPPARMNFINTDPTYFRAVLNSDADNLKPLAHYYLASMAGAHGDLDLTLTSLLEAKKLVDTLKPSNPPDDFDKMNVDLKKKIDETLAEFNKPKWFGNLTLLGGYDSNVLSAPSTGSLNVAATGDASTRGIFKAALGHASAPMDPTQYVWNYQGSINLNSNRDTQTGQFIVNDISLFMNRSAYSSSSWGGKLEATSIFQYQVDPNTDKGSFGPYILEGSFGPYFRKEIYPEKFLGVETYFEPRNNYLDPAFSPSQRSTGWDAVLHPTYTINRVSKWWNPTFEATYRYHDTVGTEYKNNAIEAGISDVLYWSRRLQYVLSASYAVTNYPVRPEGIRNDQTFSYEISMSGLITRKWTFLFDTLYVVNKSNVQSLFQYNRLQANVGAAYVF